MTVGSLFAGIGGMDLGLERSGMEIKWQVEIDLFCRKVLEVHWANVRRYEDVKEVHGVSAHTNGGSTQQGDESRQEECETDGGRRETFDSTLSVRCDRSNEYSGKTSSHSEDGIPCPNCLEPVDLICGGFPCQPFSHAGKRGGSDDNRHLWPEMFRVIREVRPRWVLAENVPGIVNIEQGLVFEQVYLDLESEGYQVQSFVIPACSVNAPHRRDRVWIVGYSMGSNASDSDSHAADTENTDRRRNVSSEDNTGWRGSEAGGQVCSNWDEDWYSVALRTCIRGVDDGIPRKLHRTERLKALGNSVLPQIPEIIGRAIMEIENNA